MCSCVPRFNTKTKEEPSAQSTSNPDGKQIQINPVKSVKIAKPDRINGAGLLIWISPRTGQKISVCYIIEL